MKKKELARKAARKAASDEKRRCRENRERGNEEKRASQKSR